MIHRMLAHRMLAHRMLAQSPGAGAGAGLPARERLPSRQEACRMARVRTGLRCQATSYRASTGWAPRPTPLDCPRAPLPTRRGLSVPREQDFRMAVPDPGSATLALRPQRNVLPWQLQLQRPPLPVGLLASPQAAGRPQPAGRPLAGYRPQRHRCLWSLRHRPCLRHLGQAARRQAARR